jgi:hypothetical protein
MMNNTVAMYDTMLWMDPDLDLDLFRSWIMIQQCIPAKELVPKRKNTESWD